MQPKSKCGDSAIVRGWGEIVSGENREGENREEFGRLGVQTFKSSKV
jgi:hypothetical protein